MSREELAQQELQRGTSNYKETRENDTNPNITTSSTVRQANALNSSHLQQDNNTQQLYSETSLKADSSQEIKMNQGRKQQWDSEKDISRPITNTSNSVSQSVTSPKDINSYNNHESSTDEFENDDPNVGGGGGGGGVVVSNAVDQEHPSQTNKTSSSQRTSVNNQQRPTKLPPSRPSNTTANNRNPSSNGNNTTTASTATNIYPNGGQNVTASTMYEDVPIYTNQQFMHVPSQYYPPQIFPGNPQYWYARPPQMPPPPNQAAFVRSNVYPSYHTAPVMHPPPPFQSPTPSPLIQHLHAPNNTRYLNPGNQTGGDSGFSSRRSSVDQLRTPDFGPQHSSRNHQKKPKQLDKALWVGNLPDSTTREELENFFADENMESVFLIKKSNCAFVNYKTHEAVIEAEKKYHEAEFKDAKLVCRPRKNNPTDFKEKIDSLPVIVSESTPPLTPSETGSSSSSSARSHRSSLPPPRQCLRQPSVASMSPASSVSSNKPPSQSRYFILKSLTQDDLDISVRNGVWATQPHNEASLNKAFKNAENVYLIFSANKSGEFYGYARMASPISKDSNESIKWTPIDDAALAASSSRPSPVQEEMMTKQKKSQEDGEDCDEDGGSSRNWGTAFKVEWINTEKLSFMRTRHLRNPWNANREVKISRDGTEVEPNVGARLLTEFHKVQAPLPFPTLSGPLLTQPLTIENQGLNGEGQDRQILASSQASGSSLQGAITPMIEQSYISSPGPYFAPPPPSHFWPQPIMIPGPYGAAPPGYIPSPQPAWAALSAKDPSTGRPQMIPLDQQTQQPYMEVVWPIPSHHPNPYQALSHPPHHLPQAPHAQAFYRPEDSQIPYSQQQQQQQMDIETETEAGTLESSNNGI